MFPRPAISHDFYTPPPGFFPPRVSSAAPSAVPSASSSVPTHILPSASLYHNRPLIEIDRPARPPPAPRRQVAEEDECPICGEELPPKGPNGESAEREAHVEDCISSHLYSGTPPPRTVSAPPDTITEGPSSVSASTSVPSGGFIPTASSSMPRAGVPMRPRRMTGGRMLVYKATEKDCVGEDGEAAECVICFEEFEEGDEMGRLECLCRFHRVSHPRSL
jgi:hypothetical protein